MTSRHINFWLLVATLWCKAAFAQTSVFTYNSSIDPTVTNMEAYCWFDSTKTNSTCPVVVMMHGLGSTESSMSAIAEIFMTNYNCFCLGVGMRGRNAASGDADYSGREIYDIYDALVYVRSHYVVSQSQAVIMGISGGGGNTLAAACKFPDTFGEYADYFGMSHYDGWNTWADTNNYTARDARLAVTNLLGGSLFIYHNINDATVAVQNSYDITNVLGGAGFTNWLFRCSTTNYYHQTPTNHLDSESDWCLSISNRTVPVWTMPRTGNVCVLGYLVAKEFSIWLGGGTNQVAQCSYNLDTSHYALSPISPAGINATVTQSGHTTVTTNFSSPVAFYLDPPATSLNVKGSANIGTLRGP